MKPIRISVNALGGQGGGVLADWIVSLGEAEGWVAQATSVPGVAQRTGATVYYIELCPPDPEGRAPVQALMPVPGDVDIVIASELMEAGRAIARGLVTPDRTTLIASSHRIFAIAEKSAMGDGITSPARVLDACRTSARRLVLADLNALAERQGSVISAALFGALAGSGALPFSRDAFEAAIRRGGVGVESSLRAFSAAFDLAKDPAREDETAARPAEPPATLETLRHMIASLLPGPVHATAMLGVERLVDYQDADYARTYLDRLEAFAKAERQLTGGRDEWLLTREVARHLALWMAYEDVIRVADLKTRSARLARVLDETRAGPGHIVHVTEFMHPRFEEFCDMMPNRIGRRLAGSDRARSWISSLIERDRTITTSKPAGFVMLFLLARLRRFRRGTYRFANEAERIDAWLASALNAARSNAALGLEIIRCQRLVKGYGDTHARGLHSFATIMRLLPVLATRGEGADAVRRLREAALKDDEGRALSKAVADLNAKAPLYNAA
jgi:indolepyruvate ferredoxin oxidoreductase beta subunit